MFSQRMCNNFSIDYLLLLLRYTLLYFIYVLAWGIKNITYGIFFTFFLWTLSMLIGVELLGIFILILISLNISNVKFSLINGVFCKSNCTRLFFAHPAHREQVIDASLPGLVGLVMPCICTGVTKIMWTNNVNKTCILYNVLDPKKSVFEIRILWIRTTVSVCCLTFDQICFLKSKYIKHIRQMYYSLFLLCLTSVIATDRCFQHNRKMFILCVFWISF